MIPEPVELLDIDFDDMSDAELLQISDAAKQEYFKRWWDREDMDDYVSDRLEQIFAKEEVD